MNSAYSIPKHLQVIGNGNGELYKCTQCIYSLHVLVHVPIPTFIKGLVSSWDIDTGKLQTPVYSVSISTGCMACVTV